MTLHIALEVGGAADVGALTRAVRTAESAGIALVTLADAPVEAGVAAAFLSRRTDRIGLAPTLHVTTTEPFHLATQLASLDHASLGRAAWIVGAADTRDALDTIGRAPLTPEALRQETADVLEAARRLWDSWEDDAIIKDVATGRFLDRRRVHHIDFEGPTFSIVGPLITPRPPQGQVVVFGADSLGVTGQLDVALIGGDDLRRRAEQARGDGAALVFAEVHVAAGGSAADLIAALSELDGVVDGVRLRPADLEADLPLLTERVLPAVAHSTPVAGRTLRDTLGLSRPANRYATAGSAS